MTLGRSYFEDLYQRDRDPWGFHTRWYEMRKRQVTLASLPGVYYETVFEPGCATGLLTEGLARRSSRVLAMDISAVALAEARTNQLENVEFLRGSVPADWPKGHFDLVVVSELGYYLDEGDCRHLAERAVTTARDLIAVHWRHRVKDYPLTGDHVHAIIERAASDYGLAQLCNHVEADYLLGVWSRDHRSVAGRTGLVRP